MTDLVVITHSKRICVWNKYSIFRMALNVSVSAAETWWRNYFDIILYSHQMRDKYKRI